MIDVTAPLVLRVSFFFFFNDTATTEIYTLSLHDALPIYSGPVSHPDFDVTLRRRADRDLTNAAGRHCYFHRESRKTEASIRSLAARPDTTSGSKWIACLLPA